MDFLETLKRDAETKYSEMLSGETKSPIKTVDIASTTEFVEKNKAYHNRLKTEAKQFAQSLETTNKNAQSRIKLEELKRQQAQAEQDRIIWEAKHRAEEKAAKKKKIIIACVAFAVVIAIVVAIIVGVSAKKKKEARNYGAENISISVLSKTNGAQSYSNYTTNLEIKVKNDCAVEITYLKCNMIINAVDSNAELWKGDVRLTGDVPSNGGTSTWDLELKSSNNDLWNYPLDGLKIQCQWTSATFDDYTTKDYSEPYKIINSGNANYRETSYQNAMSLYSSGKYSEAKAIFDVLGDYKESEWYASQCENKTFYQEMEIALHNTAGNNAILPDNYTLYLSYSQSDWYYYQGQDYLAFSCDFRVNAEEESTFLTKFRNKLVSNGFNSIDSNTYKKGSTMIHFSDIQEGWSDKYVNYYAWKIN